MTCFYLLILLLLYFRIYPHEQWFNYASTWAPTRCNFRNTTNGLNGVCVCVSVYNTHSLYVCVSTVWSVVWSLANISGKILKLRVSLYFLLIRMKRHFIRMKKTPIIKFSLGLVFKDRARKMANYKFKSGIHIKITHISILHPRNINALKNAQS